MSEVDSKSESGNINPGLDQGTYEILRARLNTHGTDLTSRLEKLNTARKEIFGSIPTALVATERITTKNNCTPRDMIPVGGGRFLFGYNVLLGLRLELQLADVFAVYEHHEHQFKGAGLEAISDPQFETDFKGLYRYYKNAHFTKFALFGPHLFMEFRVGPGAGDIKTFKWLCDGGTLSYLGNRFDHEYQYPPQHEFEWKRTYRELHRHGLHPHISIEDRVFVECVGGDFTIKVEDNTASGEGIYSEPVEQRDQTLDDAEIYYSIVGSLILLKVKPYQEKAYRYFVFNEKVKEVRRIDSIEDSCVLLPDHHGIIFARGYYLQSGEFKLFDTALEDMSFNKRIISPNGEDLLYTFYHQTGGDYVLLSYNLITRSVETPIICNGFSIFDNGEMALFRSEAEPQKHHAIQIWQTPYVGTEWQGVVKSDNYLFKLGNAALVGAMAECQGVLGLLKKDDTFGGLYLDIVKATTDLIDTYFWLGKEEAFDVRTPLVAIKEAASAALAEFEKVSAIRKNTAAEVVRVTGHATAVLQSLPTQKFDTIAEFVNRLAEMRMVRGELISLKELRYADLPFIQNAEEEITAAGQALAERTVEFLLKPEALQPFQTKAEELRNQVPALTAATNAQKLDEDIVATGKELDLLIETVSNLKIQDATETTRVVEAISTIYATLNQTKATLKQKIRDLRGSEAVAEFGSQTRLLDQALTNYLDLCASPEKCDSYLNKLMVQVEELEARFADFEEFVIQLGEKRTQFSGAFEARKIEIVEARNKKANGLLSAGDRILKGIKHRAENAETLDALNSYLASDAMVEKIRDLIKQLIELGDSVKADDLGSRLKSLREDAVRQLKDRQELFVGGTNVIQLGRHRFLTNTQELELTIVPRNDQMFLHLTGTNFFEPVQDEAFEATRFIWGLDVISESPAVYRGEYLAYKLLQTLEAASELEAFGKLTPEAQLTRVQEFMTPRYTEGYVKGVHDQDAAKILAALAEMNLGLDLLRFPAQARTLAALYWHQLPEGDTKKLLLAELRALAAMEQVFPGRRRYEKHVAKLKELLTAFTQTFPHIPATCSADAAEYLLLQLQRGNDFAVSDEALEIFNGFSQHLTSGGFTEIHRSTRQSVESDFVTSFVVFKEWIGGYMDRNGVGADPEYLEEATWLLLRNSHLRPNSTNASGTRDVSGLHGSHPSIQNGTLPVRYVEFMQRLRKHESETVPAFERFQHLKRDYIKQARKRIKVEDFKPKVLTSFVRNQLIDSVFLPMVGDNLAKQIGADGDTKRTDRMGLLLLVSPPGYGKTTLMEYVASRLGIVFMKVNGPAIGHNVTSLDPGEAPNAAAREEIEKLNLAFEMGDNVMICLDDIQHLNSEFLQKFISLCDGSRRIEGVYRGQSRTYDLRGKKIAVVMTGNPYTESGERFRIPDMLANRADTYNLGDVVGGHLEVFKSSYLQNAATSNPVLARVAMRHPKDISTAIDLVANGAREGLDYEGGYSSEELQEIHGVAKKLLHVRDVVFRVNEEYIRSAAQADAYRTEPAFKLQGSYRNMNRLAEKVSPVMNDTELTALLQNHYRNEAQTLTSGAEANLLKFREITETLKPEEQTRWEEIKKTFRKNMVLGGDGGENDPVSRVVQKLSAFYDGLDAIKEVLASAASRKSDNTNTQPVIIIAPPAPQMSSGTSAPALSLKGPDGNDMTKEVHITQETLQKIWELIGNQDQEKPAVDSKKKRAKE